MLIARSVHPLPGEAERKGATARLVDGFSEPPRPRRRRPDRRRIHLRRGCARVARGAGAHPEVRHHRDGRRRRRQRRQQRGRARRPGDGWPASSAPIRKAGGCSRAFTAASIARAVIARARLPNAGQDADSRRRHSFGQAAGGADRSRAGWPLAEPSAASLAESADARPRRLRRRHPVGLRIGTRHAGARRRDSRSARAAVAAAADARSRRFADTGSLDYRRPHDVHAERVGGRAGARHPDRRRSRGARAGRPGAAAEDRHAGGARHARQPRHGALRAAGSRRSTFRFSDPTRWPT